MGKKGQNEVWIMWILKSLLAAYVVTGILLMRMADDSLCYLTRRIDRTPAGEKIAMEDMCQLTERQTEHKYKSSYERIGKAVLKYSSLPKMDVTNFFELVLFSWLTGNNDMHLKNFSLYEAADKIRLTPAYDLLDRKSTRLNSSHKTESRMPSSA